MQTKELLQAGERLIASALRAGATGVACRLSNSDSVGVTIRDGALENVSASSDRGCSMQVLVGAREANVSSASLLPLDLDRLAEDAVAMAKISAENKYLALATPDLWPCNPKKIPGQMKELELYDGAPLRPIKHLKDDATELDRIARAFPGIGRAEGSSAGHSRGVSVRMTSLGFRGAEKYSQHSKWAGVIAERDGEMHSGSDSHSAYFLEDLRSSEECTQRAGERAVSQLGAKSITTKVMPVVFDNRVSPALLQMFFGAIAAGSVYRKSTFLLEKLGEPVFLPEVTIVDEPHLKRRIGSQLYDAECVGMIPRTLVDRGVLNMWRASIESGAKIGIKSTGHASGSSNLSMLPGNFSREKLLADIPYGLLVTDLMGHGPNMATGAYSAGVEGFLIEGGAVTRPVNKVTIAGNLLEMFRGLRPASDMSDHTRTNAPTCFIDRMTVGGK